MNVLRLRLEDYRNLQPADLSFSPEINVIYGKNAQGKTNLLEAVWLFTGGHSFRGAKDSELVAFGKKRALLKLDFFSEEREQAMELVIQEGKRAFTVNGVEKRSAAELVGKFCSVIFSPEHLLLVKGGPAKRRGFLDGALCQSRPSFAKAFVLYQRALHQRNILLKEIPRQPSLQATLASWNTVLAQRGAAVIRQRQALVEAIRQPVREIYGGLAQGLETVDLVYSSTVGKEKEITEEMFLQRLEAAEKTDIAAGFTTIGPHRDDLEIAINGVSARLYGSQGQQRSAVLALKLAEAAVLEELTGEKPVILLDDVMSELDRDRQEYLLNHIRSRQIFLTCCDPGAIRGLRGGAAFFVSEGKSRPTTG